MKKKKCKSVENKKGIDFKLELGMMKVDVEENGKNLFFSFFL